MGQPAQWQPQEDFPFLLPLTMLRIISATVAAKTTQIRMVARFSVIHISI
jgi:hypothetical protein